MKYLIPAILGIILVSCGPTSFTTTEGTVVTYIEKGNGEQPIDSLISLFNIRYATDDGRVLEEGDPTDPVPLKIDEAKVEQLGNFYEILSKLKTGDSVSFDFVAATLFSDVFQAPLPDSIAAESMIKFQVAFQEQITESTYYRRRAEKVQKLEDEQLAKDIEIIENYLTENAIETETTDAGIRYVITEAGSGPNAVTQQEVRVNYTGYLLNGEIFDTSHKAIAQESGVYDERREPYEPLKFTLDVSPVIKGWHMGIQLLNVGAKATLYIPSTLAYGSRASGVIAANSVLVFDVELVEIVE